MRRVALAALAALALIVAGLLGLYIWRKPIAAALAERYLAGLGVPSSIQFERLDAHGALARVRLGEPAHPDLTATIAASLAWEGLTPQLRTVDVSSALLRARFDGRRLELGSLDRLTAAFTARAATASGGTAVAPAAVNLDADVKDARVQLDTPEGVMTLDCAARIASGHLQALSVELQPTTLRAGGIVAVISGGTLRATAAGAGWNARAELLARGTFAGQGAALTAGRAQLQLRAEDVVPEAGAIGSGPLEASAELDALSARLGAARPRDIGAARLGLTLAATRAQLGTAGGGTASLEGLDAALQARELQGRLAQGSALVPSLTARARGTVGLHAGKPSADLQASAQFSGALTSSSLRDQVRRLALSAHAPAAAAALERALRRFSVSAPQLHVLLGPRLVRYEAQAPVTVRAADGVQLSLAPEGRLPLLSAASGSESGALRLQLSGGGLPRLRVAIGSYTLGRDARGRTRASAHVAVAAALSLPPLEGLSFSSVARVQLLGASYRIVLAQCAPIGLRALKLPASGAAAGAGAVAPEIAALRLELCPAAGPLLRGDAHAWAVQARWRSLALRAPAAEVALADGSGQLQAAGAAGAIRTAGLSIAAAQLSDEARPVRFNPLGVAGAMRLAGDRWRGALAIHRGASARPIATAQLQYSPASAEIQALLEVGPLAFTPGGLQPGELSPLLASLRDASGGAAFQGRLTWSHGALQSSGRLSLTNFGFTSPVGPVRQIEASIELPSLLPLRSAPGQQIRVGSIGSVASVTRVAARFQLLPEAVRIEEATMQAAGGSVSLDPTTMPLNPKATIHATVRVHDIDLNQLVAASSLASSVKLQVQVSGAIPFSIGPAGVHFSGGELASNAPGQLQIARTVWGPVAGPGQTNAFQDFAFQALAHLRVEQLSGALNSLPGGRLGLLLHIRGENDPPVPAVPRIGLLALLRGHAFDKPMPLPAGTPIDLTLDTSLNFDELLAALRPSSPTTH